MADGNLFTDAVAPADGERFDELLRHGRLVIERIVSSDRTDGRPYEQPQDEWVVLLRGAATVEVAGQARSLVVGDHLFLPAGTPHRVTSTSPGALWLAVHLHPDAG